MVKNLLQQIDFLSLFPLYFSQSPITFPESPIERGDSRVSLSLLLPRPAVASLPAVADGRPRHGRRQARSAKRMRVSV